MWFPVLIKLMILIPGMAILGNIIKGAIKVAETVSSIHRSPEHQQIAQLRHLLKEAKYSEFGIEHEFSDILHSKDIRKAYAERVAYVDYDDMFTAYWHKVLEGESDITWPGTVSYFAKSSGTTGKEPKHIPVTNAMIDSIRKTGIQQLLSLSHFDIPAEVFEKEVLMLGSSTDLAFRQGHYEGEISGISASNIPSWFEHVYKPGKEIAKIDDFDQRIHEIAKAAPDWDIGALSGIPSWIHLMLKYIVEYHQLDNIHEIWPNLTLYTSGGVAFEPYRKNIEALLAHPLIYLDTYLASEGFFAFNSRPETPAMQLVLDQGVYFEFVPFDQEHVGEDGKPFPNTKPILIEEVEQDKDYVMVISTCSGAWRYLIGDTIRFTDTIRKEILITGRTKFFLNVVGSQLSVDKMIDGITRLEDFFDIKIEEFTVAAVEINEGWAHKWFIGTEDHVEVEEVSRKLDEFILDNNKGYREARKKALKKVIVVPVSPDLFYQYQDQEKHKGGQVKFARVLTEDQLSKWEEFLTRQNG